MIKSHFKKFATLSLSATLFAGIGITAAADATTAPVPVAQATLVVSNSVTTGTVNAATGITLTATGGSGTGTVSFAIVTGAACKIKTGALSATAPGTCVVKATKAASHDTTHSYLAATSANQTFTFSFATRSSKLAISNSSTFAAVGQQVKLTTSDAVTADLGKVSFAISPANSKCAVASNGTLTATSGTTCSVVATKAAKGVYGAATSDAVVFTFQPLTAVATVTSVRVSTTATGPFSTLPQINDTANGLSYFILAYYAPQDHWYQSYLPAGDYVQITYMVSDLKGKPVKQQTVSLADNLAYSGAHGTTWSDAALTADQGSSTATPKTDNMGHVTFTLHNTNSVTGLNPNDTTTAGAAEGIEGNAGSYPWTRFVLKIGSTGKWTGALTDVNEATDLQDFIVVPGASAKKAQATLTVTNATTAVNGASVTLTTAGGSGSGAVTFDVTGTGCSIASGVLSVAGNASANCSVTATKAADATYGAATSDSVNFTFGAAPDAPSNTNPDVATLTSVTGTNGAQLDNTVAGDVAFINKYYNPNDHWFLNYLVAGSTITETWHLTGSYGQVLKNTAVSLIVNQNYSGSAGTTWSENGISGTSGVTIAGTTNASGDVTFTLHNTNSVSGYNPAVLNDPAAAAGQEGAFPWTRTTLQVGSLDFSDSNTANIVQQTDEVDLIVIPGVTAPACGNHCPTNTKPDVATLTSVTGITGSTLDDSAAGALQFINKYFLTGDSWTQSYLAEGATVVENWHVTFNGAPLANTAVTLYDNQAYSGSKGTSWSNAALNVNNGTAPGGSLSGITDASGNVSFTLVNTNTETGTAPTNDELTTTGGTDVTSTGAGLYEKTAPLWTRTYLVVGNDDIANGGNQKTAFTDLIVIPATATAPAVNPCASATVATNACQVVVTTTSVTGAASAQLDDTVNGKAYFLDQYYSPNAHWYEYFIHAGSTITVKYHVSAPNGSALANAAVSLNDNQPYSHSPGVSWTESSLLPNPNICAGSLGYNSCGPQGTLAGTTDANGDVSFTLTSADTVTTAAPSDITTTDAAGKAETVYPWTPLFLQVGSNSYAATSSTNTEQVDRVDIIVIP